MLCLWSAKGGAGVSVVAAALGVLSARRRPTLLVDFGGDAAAILGLDTSRDHSVGSARGVVDWLRSERPPPDALARMEVAVVPGLSLLPAGVRFSTGAADPSPPEADEPLSLLAQILAADDRSVIVDLGQAAAAREAMLAHGGTSVLITRACYLALRRAVPRGRPDRVVFVRERGRALRTADVSTAIGSPITVEVEWESSVARAVDAGLLASRLPPPLRRLEDLLPTSGVQPHRSGRVRR